MSLYKTELFEIEPFIGIKMDLVLNDLQWLICHKPNQTIANMWLHLRWESYPSAEV